MVPDGEAAAGPPPAPLVTVVVATFNSRVTLACALSSVQRQACSDFEVWVVGDGCTDDSEAAVTALADPRFHWTNLAPNSGSQSTPNNEGLRRARGRYVAYLGHDDLWFPWHLATLLEAAARDAAGVVYGLGALLGPGDVLASGPPRRGASHHGHFVPPTNWLVERALLERIGPWRQPGDIGRPVDVDVLDRLAATGARIVCAQRLTTIKFPSTMWRSYAPDAPRPQLGMSEELTRDPDGLAERLLCDIAAEHARATFPTWGPPPSLLWRDAAVRMKRALGASLRRFHAAPILGAVVRWHYQRGRLRARARRGLDLP
jgi:glycosyltransferase involved in cell wall biosynthesis